jgi:hypothetical protein
VIKKEAEKILKYKEIITEIQGTWNVGAEMILIYLLTYLCIYFLTSLLCSSCNVSDQVSHPYKNRQNYSSVYFNL